MSMPDPLLVIYLHNVAYSSGGARFYSGRDEGFCWSNIKYGDSEIDRYQGILVYTHYHQPTVLSSCLLHGQEFTNLLDVACSRSDTHN